jgi:Flp pilus assembly protein TadD
MSVAVERITHDDNDRAIDLFQRVLELEPNNTLALNNLATLLAERPNELGQAQKYAERAITVAGRSPALLDTLGTIFIRTSEFDRAVATLEEAVAGTTTDPRYYFHLAVAYQRSRRATDARTALETAKKRGLDRAILTAGDRDLLGTLEQSLTTTAANN